MPPGGAWRACVKTSVQGSWTAPRWSQRWMTWSRGTDNRNHAVFLENRCGDAARALFELLILDRVACAPDAFQPVAKFVRIGESLLSVGMQRRGKVIIPQVRGQVGQKAQTLGRAMGGPILPRT